jgi:RNA polymerase sigma-B factor
MATPAPSREHGTRTGRLDPELRAQVRELLAELKQLPEGSARHTAVRDQLVELNVPLVRYLARRFPASKEPLDDLVQVGIIGLLKAIDRFDPERGLEFSTYAVPTILGEIKRYFRDSTWAIHVPRGTRDLHSAIVSARAELTQELGRSLTLADLAERVRATEQDVLEALDAGQTYTSSSLDAMADALGAGRDGAFGFTDGRLEQVEWRADLRPAIASLPQQQRRVLMLRFVYDQSQTQIAKAMGVSQMQVSRLLSRSMRQLRSELTGVPVEQPPRRKPVATTRRRRIAHA